MADSETVADGHPSHWVDRLHRVNHLTPFVGAWLFPMRKPLKLTTTSGNSLRFHPARFVYARASSGSVMLASVTLCGSILKSGALRASKRPVDRSASRPMHFATIRSQASSRTRPTHFVEARAAFVENVLRREQVAELIARMPPSKPRRADRWKRNDDAPLSMTGAATTDKAPHIPEWLWQKAYDEGSLACFALRPRQTERRKFYPESNSGSQAQENGGVRDRAGHIVHPA